MKQRIVAIAVFLLVVSATGQVRMDKPSGPPGRQRKPSKGAAEFTFVRTIYNSPFRGWRGSWATDFPEADYHFIWVFATGPAPIWIFLKNQCSCRSWTRSCLTIL